MERLLILYRDIQIVPPMLAFIQIPSITVVLWPTTHDHLARSENAPYSIWKNARDARSSINRYEINRYIDN